MMKNFQKLALGLLVMVFAIGFSAFTEIKKVDAGDIYVQSTSGDWKRINPLEFDDQNCVNNSEAPCYYVQSMSDPNDHGETLTQEDIDRIGGFQASDKEGLYIEPVK